MRHLLAASVTTVAIALLALARWLEGGSTGSPHSGSGSGSCRNQPAKRTEWPVEAIDLPRSHYRFSHVPPSRWQVIKTGLAILFSSVRFAVSSTGFAGAGA